MTRNILIYGDGSCLGNPGPGGWAVHVNADGAEHELSGGAANTTNNRMEVSAALAAYSWLAQNARRGDQAVIRFDSQYAIKGSFEWLEGWKKKGWRTSSGSEVVNVDLWQKVDDVLKTLKSNGVILKPEWVRGHDGEPGNERADSAARAMAESWRDAPGGPASMKTDPVEDARSLITAWLSRMHARDLVMLDIGHFRQIAPDLPPDQLRGLLDDMCSGPQPWLRPWAIYVDAYGDEVTIEPDDYAEYVLSGELVDPNTGHLVPNPETRLSIYWEKRADAPTGAAAIHPPREEKPLKSPLNELHDMSTAPRDGRPVLAVFRDDITDHLQRDDLDAWAGTPVAVVPADALGWKLALPVCALSWTSEAFTGWKDIGFPEPAPTIDIEDDGMLPGAWT